MIARIQVIVAVVCCGTSFFISPFAWAQESNKEHRAPVISSSRLIQQAEKAPAESSLQSEESAVPAESAASYQDDSTTMDHVVQNEAAALADVTSAGGKHRHRFAADGCGACGGWGCNACGRERGLFSGFYGHVQYMHWWADGMYVPALVTTSPDGTPREDAGVRSAPGTEVLFGERGINTGGRNGGRVTLGYWLRGSREHAIEGDYFNLGDANDHYQNSSIGTPILARPYFDINQGLDNSELVAFPNVLAGTIAVDPISRFLGAGLRKRWNICGCESGDDCNPCGGNSCHTDFTIGYRYLKLDDRLSIREDLTSLETGNPGAFIVYDSFKTWNTFQGVEFGVVYSKTQGLWSLELLNRLAIGTTQSRVAIDGYTDSIQNGVTTRGTGGLLTQTSNIGSYEHDTLSIAPELGITIGYRLNPVWKTTFGYSFLYWSNVLRAGHHIDTDVNTLLVPPQGVVTGPLRPRFEFDETDFWAMGINLGLEANW